MADAFSDFFGFKRLTIKIGSALLVDADTGALRKTWLKSLAADIAELKSQGMEIVIVSSGAISLGRRILRLDAETLPLDQSQAAAAVGQIALSQAFSDILHTHNIVAGQILVTPNITEQRRHFLNAKTTMNTLLELGAVPIINENDSVATSEIRYGDNDRLSARVATMVESDGLIIFSDVDGLYSAAPHIDPNAEFLPRIERITPEIEAMAGGAASHLSRGGMRTKIEAAKMAVHAGTAMIIAKGAVDHPLRAVAKGARHSFFVPMATKRAARKNWIMSALPAGRVTIDAGAANALAKGTSLLPIGVTAVEGAFGRGDAISIFDPTGVERARGLSNFDAADAQMVLGKRSDQIAEIFGPSSRTELVHRDNLVLLEAS
ncbi:glutamate 5-kinase [Maritalea sp. S77]|uniref:glutamate 5-kinase n=1 Tax=Maritalea sp. S77 TaxID=3415125 RepID=UPI003C7A74E0